MHTLYTGMVICLLLLSRNSPAQPSITYRLSLDNIVHHELRIQVIFTGLTTDSLTIVMPNSSPGRYAEHQFAKNLYEERAYASSGKPVSLMRTSTDTWIAPVTNGTLLFEYTLYGNHADGTYTGIDSRKLHLNMPATFVYGENLQEVPIDLIINLKERPEWTVATQLVKKNDSTFSAPNYYYFYDSPTMAGDIHWRSWKSGDQMIEMAIMHEGDDDELNDYVAWCRKVVEAEKQVFGELPRFDYGRYTFLVAYNPWVHGDGMEHRNSTVCTSSGNLAENAGQLIGTIAHEFFHAWNIERLRPASLEPFDFDEANQSGELWFGEGFTNYYDGLILCRTGIKTPRQYLNSLSGTMNYVSNFPGRDFRGPVQMSQNAPFTDAGTANDETNFYNTFISYYSYGEVLGLALDLMLRSTFPDLTLDHYMRYLWETYGKTEKPYTLSEMEEALAKVTRNKTFAAEYFQQYIYGSALPDFKVLFSAFGISMKLRQEGAVNLGSVTVDVEGRIASPVQRNTGLYEAGLEKGDRILSINGQKITSQNDLQRVSASLETGKRYEVEFEQLGKGTTGSFTAKQDPAFSLEFLSGPETSEAALIRRNDWLNVPMN